MTDPDPTCPTCPDWGRTLTDYEALTIPGVCCPTCRRPTWPNLGVNLPAGCAVSWGTARAFERALTRPDGGPLDVLYARSRAVSRRGFL